MGALTNRTIKWPDRQSERGSIYWWKGSHKSVDVLPLAAGVTRVQTSPKAQRSAAFISFARRDCLPEARILQTKLARATRTPVHLCGMEEDLALVRS